MLTAFLDLVDERTASVEIWVVSFFDGLQPFVVELGLLQILIIDLKLLLWCHLLGLYDQVYLAVDKIYGIA